MEGGRRGKQKVVIIFLEGSHRKVGGSVEDWVFEGGMGSSKAGNGSYAVLHPPFNLFPLRLPPLFLFISGYSPSAPVDTPRSQRHCSWTLELPRDPRCPPRTCLRGRRVRSQRPRPLRRLHLDHRHHRRRRHRRHLLPHRPRRPRQVHCWRTRGCRPV